MICAKKEFYTREEARSMLVEAIKNRGRYLACFYKHMPKELFDQVAKKALYEYGLSKTPSKKGDVVAMVEILNEACHTPGSTVGYATIEQLSDQRAVMTFHDGCVLLDAWREMGLSDRECEYLCDVACYGDYGYANAHELKSKFLHTMAHKGKDTCKYQIEKLPK